MLAEILDLLICPLCRPHEPQLAAQIDRQNGNDIIHATLSCPACGQRYEVRNGIADLRPPTNQQATNQSQRYETDKLLSSYLWSHFADYLGDPMASSAYRDWAAVIENDEHGIALDIGCAVGRMSLELRRKAALVIGLDASFSFVRAARELIRLGSCRLQLPDEGHLGHEVEIDLPADHPRNRIDFIVADALALPFKSNRFAVIAGLNLVDKLPQPLEHLRECHRVARRERSQLLISDPFSWSEEVTGPGNWLGGTDSGPFAGLGRDNISRLLSRELTPAWQITNEGSVWWKIRTHQNHYELIRSCYLKAELNDS